MDRRGFLKSVTAGATAVAAGTAAANATGLVKPGADFSATKSETPHRTLRLGLGGPDNCQSISDFLRQFAARVRAATEGALSIEVAQQNDNGLDAITSGAVDCYCATEHAHISALPALAYFAGLPGKTAMSAEMLFNWLAVGGGQALWDGITADVGVKCLAIANTGAFSALWSQTPIDSVAALAGKSIYAEGLAGDVVRGLGAEVFSGGVQNVAEGLARGEIFAAEVGDIPAAVSSGLAKTARVAAIPSINRFGSIVAFGINKTLWDGFSAGERALLEAAAAASYHETLAFSKTHNDMMKSACHAQWGARFVELNSEVHGAIANVSDIVIAHLAARSPSAESINASYMAFLKSHQATS